MHLCLFMYLQKKREKNLKIQLKARKALLELFSNTRGFIFLKTRLK